MAGNRRRLKEIPDGAALPSLGNDETEVGAYLTAVASAVVDGWLDHAIARELISAAKAKLASMRQKNEREELETLKRMLAEAVKL